MEASAEIKRLLKDSKSEQLRHNRNLVYQLASGELFSWNEHSSYRGLLNSLSTLKNMLGVQREKKESKTKDHRPRRHQHRRQYVEFQSTETNPTTLRSELRTALGLQPKTIEGFSASPHHFSTSLPPAPQIKPVIEDRIVPRLEVYTPQRSHKPVHRALGQSSPAHVMPAEILERANRALHEGGQDAFNNFLNLWHMGQITQEENTQMNTPNTSANPMQYLMDMIEAAKKQRQILENERQAANQHIDSLSEEINQTKATIEMKAHQMDEIDTFLNASEMALHQLQMIEPVLLRAGIAAVPVQASNVGARKTRALPHTAITGDTIVLMQRKREEDDSFNGLHLNEIHQYLEQKHGTKLDKHSVYGTLTHYSKKPDSKLKFLGNSTWTVKHPKVVRHSPVAMSSQNQRHGAAAS